MRGCQLDFGSFGLPLTTLEFNMLRRHLIWAIFVVWAWTTPSLWAERPNILLILTDDHGYGDVSAYRAAVVRTPHIDSIAQQGMRFTNMRANATVCSPSRAALMTGKYADRVGVPGVIRTHRENSWGYFDPGARTIADELRQVGYHTAIVGKWHLGLDSPNTPNERGFDHFHGFLGDMMDSYTHHRRHGENYLRRNYEIIEPTGHATDLFSDWAVDYLRTRAATPEEPFFLYLAYNAPHFPIEPPAEYLANVQNRAPLLDEKRAKNVAFIEHLDAGIGRVLAALADTQLERRTLVIFTADNGGSLAHAQNNDPWRGGKQSHYDGGLRVPFLARWPGHVQPGTTSDYSGLVFDLFPTVVEVAGATPSAGIDAISLVPILQGQSLDTPRDLYFTRREGGRAYGGKTYEAIIRGPWKLLQNDPYSPWELYHLQDDPYEQKDLASDHRQIVDELSTAIRDHIQRGGTIPWQAPARPGPDDKHH
jgi:arylsulfatase A-like enzyme